MLLQDQHAQIDEQTMKLIAARVTAALREHLETILAEHGQPVAPAAALTVEEVARHLGVSRSTVYAHWREWGGYKLGSGDKAPIRFDGNHLPAANATARSRPARQSDTQLPLRRKRRRRRDLLSDSPRLTQPLDGVL